MKIAVFVKEIPINNNIKIDPKTNNLIRSNQDGRMNPYDEHALESALTLKEKYGGSVTLISMGPENFKNTLYDGLAMGADNAYLLSSRAFGGSDTLATSYTLAKAVEKIGGADLLLFGVKAIDADTGQIPPLVANELNLRQVTNVSDILDVDTINKTITLEYTTEIQKVTIKTKYPLVISVDDSINTPRYQSALNIKHVFDKEITVFNEDDLDCDKNRIGMAGSRTIVTDTFVPKASSKNVVMLEKTVKDAASELVSILKEKHLL